MITIVLILTYPGTFIFSEKIGLKKLQKFTA